VRKKGREKGRNEDGRKREERDEGSAKVENKGRMENIWEEGKCGKEIED